MRLAAIIAWSVLTFLLGLAPAAAEKRVALIVGMSAYKFITPLDNPGNDARLVAETLRALGFTLIGDGPQLDLDKPSLEAAVQKFSQQMQGADVALFYYSGHGLQVRGENFLVPVAANPVREADIDFQLMDANLVLRQMEHAGTKLNVVILDACRNNPFSGRGFRSVSRGLARMNAPEGTVISYATQPGNVALDGNDGNSPYTKALAQMVRRPGLDIFQTFNEVGLAVMQATANSQQPWLASLPIKGRFYFSGESSAVPSVVPPVSVGLSDAERAWSLAKDTTSQAVLEDFIRRFGDSFYVTLARARLEELKKSQVAVVAPPVAPVQPLTPVQPAVGVFPPTSGAISVKIGVLSDMSSLYSDIGGPGSTTAAKMAIADFMANNKDIKVQLLSADHQNNQDIGLNVVNQWYDVEKVDLVIDVPNSGVALAVSQIASTKNKVFIASGAAAYDLTGVRCNANTIHWTYDTWLLSNGTGKALVKAGGDTWFFLTADYAFGHALERNIGAAVEAAGGKVLGKVRHPLNTYDFSSFLLQAQNSKAKIIGLANAGGDTINSIKKGAKFGIVKGSQKFAGLLVFASDVNVLGLATARGLTLTETWYWDANETNRAWTKRWQAERAAAGKFPTMVQAGVYAGITHYLKAVAALKSAADGKAVVAKMKSMPTDDPLFGKGTIRVDGRKVHDAYLFEVKGPAESKYPGDFYKLRGTIPAAEAFRPLNEGGCPLVRG